MLSIKPSSLVALLFPVAGTLASSLQQRDRAPCSGDIIQSFECPSGYTTAISDDPSFLICSQPTLDCVYDVNNGYQITADGSSSCPALPTQVSTCSQPCESPLTTYACPEGPWSKASKRGYNYCRKGIFEANIWKYEYCYWPLPYTGGLPDLRISQTSCPASMRGVEVSCAVPAVSKRTLFERLAALW